MKRYGLFDGTMKEPMQTYDGDKMSQNGEYVFIWRTLGQKQEQVAAIRLAPGQSVKEI